MQPLDFFQLRRFVGLIAGEKLKQDTSQGIEIRGRAYVRNGTPNLLRSHPPHGPRMRTNHRTFSGSAVDTMIEAVT